VELLIRANAKLAEGPRWWNGRLYWVDIEGAKLYVWERAIPLDAMVGAVAPVDERRVLVALADRLALLDLETERTETLCPIPHAPDVRANDGACDAEGRFWFGTMALDERPGGGAFYRYDGELVRVFDEITISNGVGWLSDGRMVYVDSPTGRVDVVEDGERRPFAYVEGGFPDGLAVDDEDGVWIAVWGGHAVHRYDVQGRVDAVLDVPAENVTACCFGGDDGRSLYVTTAAPDGNVYVAQPGVGGAPANVFHAGGNRTAPFDADDTSAR
jgi:sugar lactone lactonase YvrE